MIDKHALFSKPKHLKALLASLAVWGAPSETQPQLGVGARKSQSLDMQGGGGNRANEAESSDKSEDTGSCSTT